jgi:hypothetical protein
LRYSSSAGSIFDVWRPDIAQAAASFFNIGFFPKPIITFGADALALNTRRSQDASRNREPSQIEENTAVS